MANIFARSPYLIKINEAGQSGSKVELFLSNTNFSVSPQYTLSKLIPAANNLETLYDISPYIREYISFASFAFTNTVATNPTAQRVNVRVIRYKLVGSTYTALDTTDYIAFDGYGYYEEGSNVNLGDFGLDQGEYYFTPTTSAGILRVTTGTGYTARYTNLITPAVTNVSLTNNAVLDIARVIVANFVDGNLLEILDATSTVLATYNFIAQFECKYAPLNLDFVNKYGAWQRTCFFKAHNDTFSVENTEYNLLQTDSFDYNVQEGQRKIFNANGKKSIKVNTGWVDESWNEVLKQIMLSERILLFGAYPLKINTKSTELFKHINTKQINYSLEFEFAYDAINSVI
jgi:hypothetical protein